MATLVEASVRIEVTISPGNPEPTVVVQAASLTADGTVIRRVGLDIWPQLSAGRKTGIADLLADIETRLKAHWEIP